MLKGGNIATLCSGVLCVLLNISIHMYLTNTSTWLNASSPVESTCFCCIAMAELTVLVNTPKCLPYRSIPFITEVGIWSKG